ncbi:MAG: 50S ribosomal protein L6 [Gammaproteobacteria bacterium]|jgi:large subunit ribosomal protein L6
MSRISKKPILIPKGVEVKIDGQQINAKGPKGLLSYQVHELVSVEIKDDALQVAKKKIEDGQLVDPKFLESILGTTRSNLNNVVVGVDKGWERKLLLVGVGYRAQVQGKKINLSLGFSHPVDYQIPEGIEVETPSQTEIIVKGADKQLVGQVAANIRAIRPVEPYKGKGVRYSDERVVLKETKKK